MGDAGHDWLLSGGQKGKTQKKRREDSCANREVSAQKPCDVDVSGKAQRLRYFASVAVDHANIQKQDLCQFYKNLAKRTVFL
ncbi:hypothetical protein GOZ78_04425 [Agrobacterium vitis]|uniref:Uncharacterized protein n=1 Tax=Agrobacterium vitis TaxID=373 RepID=A0ABD6GEG7_AGRVI|nr:hypothetical protein [Agrobacterium vitis]MUO81644.1 hypothetical protein [Agrobacterium vitis]MUO95212.1 hypothetical protein [Agrobacterium vitis]MUP07352.1 hypothetical protein [Agrobacterium vitis]MUZ83666.1 hypothetical protein [Agrobacterium vitis]MVA09266.1 hypothetical protein [Agrobacterium vitis]